MIDILPQHYMLRPWHDPMLIAFAATNPDYEINVYSNQHYATSQKNMLERRRSMLSTFAKNIVPVGS